jgi:hypothetical protein
MSSRHRGDIAPAADVKTLLPSDDQGTQAKGEALPRLTEKKPRVTKAKKGGAK